MPRLLHLADLHLGWTPKGLPRELAYEVRRERDALLGQAIDLAIAERVDLVVVAGDLFESYRPDSALVASTLRELERAREAGIELLTLPGNHDELTYANSVYRLEAARWPGVLVTRPDPGPVASLNLAGARVEVAGLAYVGGVTPVEAPLRAFPHQRGDLTLAVFHGTLVPPSVRPGDLFGSGRSLPIDQRALEQAGFDYVALGHIHVPAEHRLGAEGLALYPGCVGGKGPRDVGSDSWTLVELSPGRVRVERRPATLAPVVSRDLDVTPYDDADALAGAIRAELSEQSWARVRLQGSIAFELDVEALGEELRPAARHLELVDATQSVAPALLERWAAQPTVRGAFVRRMQARLQARLEDAPDEATRTLLQRALRIGLSALAERP